MTDVDIVLGIPITIIALPILILAVIWGGKRAFEDFLKSLGNVGAEWTQKAHREHYRHALDYNEQQVLQSGTLPMKETDVSPTMELSPYGIYAVVGEQRQVVGL